MISQTFSIDTVYDFAFFLITAVRYFCGEPDTSIKDIRTVCTYSIQAFMLHWQAGSVE